MAERTPPLDAQGIVDAVLRFLQEEETCADRRMIDAAVQDPAWVLYIQDRFPRFRPEHYTQVDIAEQSDRTIEFIDRLEEITGKAVRLLPWKVPGFFARYAYSQLFGWTGTLPHDAAAQQTLLGAYELVSTAFAILDERSDPATGATKAPPTQTEATVRRDSFEGQVLLMRDIQRVYRIGHMANHLASQAHHLPSAEFRDATRAVEDAYDQLRGHLTAVLGGRRREKRQWEDPEGEDEETRPTKKRT